MSGRPKQKIYQYDIEKRKQICTYTSQQEVKNKYYDGTKYPMFVVSEQYHLLPDGSYITKESIDVHVLKTQVEIDNSVFVKLTKHGNGDEKEIEVFNLEKTKIAEFKNVRLASLLTNTKYGTIMSQLHKSKGKKRNIVGLIFKYK